MIDRETHEMPQSTPQFPGGEYAIEGVLGSGGMAVVYRARDLRRPRDVAIKVLRTDVIKLIGVERFLREIAVTAGFTHPHILPLLDSGETIDADGRSCPYYVMPLITGESLEDRLMKERRLPLKDAVRLACEILEALRYAHDHGVIHRDIKPANILLSDGHAVVADFGVARPMPGSAREQQGGKPLTEIGFVVGTPEYMSPEQALGDERVDERCDLYSVGCVLYEMVVGEPPFEGASAQMIVSRKISGAFRPTTALRPGVPAALDEVLSKALRSQPADRYASAAAFLHDLARVDVGAAAQGGSALDRLFGPSRSPWVGAAGVAALALVATFALQRSSTGALSGASAGGGAAAPVTPPMPEGKARVAVLPLGVVTSDSALDMVANALTSDLIDELARYPALTIISKNGVLPYRGVAARTDSVARVLGVGSIVTGDMRGFGDDSVAVTVRLVDGATSAQVASMKTTGAWRDVLTLRSDIIDSVASFLRTQIGVEISSERARSASNPEAWELIARVKVMADGELPRSGSLPAPQRGARFAFADTLIARAISLDPEWLEPRRIRIALALLRANLEDLTSNPAQASTLRRGAVRLADDVLAIAPGDAEALLLRGRARAALWRTDRGGAPDSLRAEAIADLRSVTQRRRDLAEAWNELSRLLDMSGAFAEARTAAEAALRADAYLTNAAAVISRLIFATLATGEIEEARRWCDRGRTTFATDPRFYGCELAVLGWTGKTPADVERAWIALAESENRDAGNYLVSAWGTRRLLVAAVAARAGLADSALAIVRQVRAGLPPGASVTALEYGEANVYTLLGRTSEALDRLERYLRENPALRGQVRYTPWFAALRGDPRFADITAPR